MKMYRALSGACLFLVLSFTLQGCDFGEPESPQEEKEEKQLEAKILPKPVKKKKAVAKCDGGNFKCEGQWREWCSRMEKKCKKKDCAPMCTWSCDSPACSQECGPVCNMPQCSTRCKGFNTDSCKMKCGKPNCKVVCPKHFCPQEDCAACKTECGKPTCRMECGNDNQPCRHVCAQPVCKWECKNPSLCPKPKCAMKCKKTPDCVQKMAMHSKVPPLEPGETEIVVSDEAPGPSPAPASALLVQRSSQRMLVNFTRMDDTGKLHTGHVDLAMVQVGAERAHEKETSWTKMVSEVAGQVTESEASCTSGKFQCQGDAEWCADQEKLGCKGSPTSSLRQSQRQKHLQA